jgi:hypothetical protein
LRAICSSGTKKVRKLEGKRKERIIPDEHIALK